MFNKYIVIYNPKSTHAKQGRKRIAELKQAAKNVQVIETVSKNRKNNQQEIMRHKHLLGPKTLLCIAAGDGTINMVVDAIMCKKHLSKEQLKTPILPLWGGNANDLAHMLNGSPRKSIKKILEKGKVVQVHPLHCKIEYPNQESESRISTSYVGFGATAYIANHLNQPKHRLNPIRYLPGGKRMSELGAVLIGFLEAPRFKISEEGNGYKIYDRTIFNGSRLGKLYLSPIRLTHPTFFDQTLKRKHILHIAPSVLKLIKGQIEHNDHVSFTCEEPTTAHFDGETEEIPATTKITITPNQNTFHALSLKERKHV